MLLRSLLLSACALAAGCASPKYAHPTPPAEVADALRADVIRDAMEVALDRRGRVYDLAWPVLTKNVDLCPETRRAIGVVIADRQQLARLSGGLREEELSFIGIDEGVRLAHVMAGSPADRAGLTSGLMLTAIGGEAVTSPEDAARAITREVARTKEAGDERVTLTVDGDARGPRDVILKGDLTCDYGVKVSTSQGLNAHAVTGDIVIYTGAIRSLQDDALQYLIAHELAHLAAEHRPKYVRNVLVSGAVVTVPLMYVAGAVADTFGGAVGFDPDVSAKAQALRRGVPWTEGFEQEADYLGLYMLARAGGDLDAAEEVFRIFARESPSTIYARVTHPLSPDRLAALDAARAEIRSKEAAGLPLLPREAPR